MQKRRNCVIMTGMMVFMLAAATGCGSGQTTDKGTDSEITVIPVEDSGDRTTNRDVGDTADGNGDENSSRDTIIGGTVRSVAQESFIISRTLVDENGCVTMPEAGSPDEQLVTIRCMDSTVFEHWTIQGGGAGIEKKEAFFSDIEEGGGLEAEGYFNGEEFVANKVIIEVYK